MASFRTQVTIDMIRKKAEHNEGEIFTLEELSLHQQDIEKIQLVDKVCPKLQILYLQGNLIRKIENLGRLKRLEYINLALNNIERIEGLEGCESLQKLDLTLNFVGELSSVKNLQNNEMLRDLYLTGNPCTEFVGYRPYCISCLPQITHLDGTAVTKSERILALQHLNQDRSAILPQEEQYMSKRLFEKKQYEEKQKESKEVLDDESFWSQPSKHTPESRQEIHEQMKQQRQREEKEGEKTKEKPQRRLFAADGRPYNVNEAQLQFHFTDEEDKACFVLTVEVYKHLDTSLLNLDVQPEYVRLIIKGKIFQLRFPESVQCDKAVAQRSQLTGHLSVTLPKVRDVVSAKEPVFTKRSSNEVSKKKDCLEGGDVCRRNGGKSTDVATNDEDEQPPPLEPL